MFVWRPFFDGMCSLRDLKDGTASLVDVMKMNAMLDARAAAKAKADKEKE
jgi:hypothetical protein